MPFNRIIVDTEQHRDFIGLEEEEGDLFGTLEPEPSQTSARGVSQASAQVTASSSQMYRGTTVTIVSSLQKL